MRLKIYSELYDAVVPTEDNRPLAVVVERIVRPLKMRTQRRWRVRSDLMAHLIAIREEERAAGGDEDAVLERTLARFGEPATLSAEIDGQTTWWEKGSGRFEKIFNRRPRERFELFALRLMVLMLGMMFFVVTFVLAFTPARRFAWPVMARTFVAVSIYVTAMLYAGVRFSESRGKSRLRLSLWLACLALLYPAFRAVLAGYAATTVAEWETQWPELMWGMLITLAVGALAGWGFDREFRYELAWANVAVE
jgi:hypothetical protein